VIHTVVDHIEDMTPALGILQKEARRFGVSDRSDEALNPTMDPRQRKLANSLEKAVMEKRLISSSHVGALETTQVMPKGRNFH